MISFDELKSRAADLAQMGATKAKDLTDIAKLNLSISSEEDAMRKAFIELGKLYYAERGMAPEGPYVSVCEQITTSKEKIESIRAQLDDRKQNDRPVDVSDAPFTAQTQPEQPAPPVEPMNSDDR